MTIGQWYWIILVVGVLFFGFGAIAPPQYREYGRTGSWLIFLVLFILIGLQTMGEAIKK